MFEIHDYEVHEGSAVDGIAEYVFACSLMSKLLPSTEMKRRLDEASEEDQRHTSPAQHETVLCKFLSKLCDCFLHGYQRSMSSRPGEDRLRQFLAKNMLTNAAMNTIGANDRVCRSASTVFEVDDY